MNDYSISVIVSFYNRLDYLKLILAAFERQSIKNFEIVVADDGSKTEVVAEIKRIAELSPLKITHVWHEDHGFRKTAILNKAIVQAIGEYLIFMDGDCIPHYRYVEEHFNNRKFNTLLAGRRANVAPRLAKFLTEEAIRNGFLEGSFSTRVFFDGIFGNSTHTIKGLYVSNLLLRKFLNRKVTGVLGSNFSIHKTDLIAVNGFDERYIAPAVGEDTDLEIRLRWNGVKIQMVKNIAIQYHLDHPKLKRSTVNERIFAEVLKEKVAFTRFGILKQ
jgi:glycosyltransferase involved in cell wall biosynthesis